MTEDSVAMSTSLAPYFFEDENSLVLATAETTDNTTLAPIRSQSAVDSPYNCKLYKLIFDGYINMFIVIFGLIGNVMVIFALWTERRKSATFFLLIVLAIADNLVLITGGFMMFVMR